VRLNPLGAAIVAGIGLGGIVAPQAQALNLDPRGVGQVLVFPYYTVNAGNQTLVSVLNNSAAGKAVKVRFREGGNARPALAFNLYLSPFDVWTASVFSRSDIGADQPANLVTVDNSCTVPRIKGNTARPTLSNGNRYAPFNNLAYTGAADDAGADNLERTREGYFELIEMGEVVNRERGSLTAITHGSNGVPADCAQIENAWVSLDAAPPATAYWTSNPLTDLAPPQGGLIGTASIIDAFAGTIVPYNAEAIDAFSDIAQHTAPSAAGPTLASARTSAEVATAHVFDDSTPVTSSFPLSRAIDAVSALFMQDVLYNEFVTSAAVAGSTEWVVTFPTKFAYADEAVVGSAAIPPFTRVFPKVASATHTGSAAVDAFSTGHIRDDESRVDFCEHAFCPFPDTTGAFFQWASNVIAFNQPNAPTLGSLILGARQVRNVHTLGELGVERLDGWASFHLFYDAHAVPGVLADRQRLRPDHQGGVWYGLPLVGFSASAYTNGELMPGVLSNYSGSFRHKGESSYRINP
jgi:hypothetical protein